MTASTQDASSKIDAYIGAAPENMREPLRRLRQVIHDAAPAAVEAFGYGLPGFKYMGRPLFYFGAAAKHYALYGNTESAVSALQEDVLGLDISKGTIRFSPDVPFTETLVRKLVAVRLAETEAAEAARKAKARTRRKSAT